MMRGTGPFWLDPADTSYRFPDVSLSLREPDGLLAVGGDLSPQRLISAYTHGIFPWYNDDQPILWWSPDPRMVLYPHAIRISRSLRKTLRKNIFSVTFDQAFARVIEACRQPRARESGTWITAEMRDAYCEMHQLGHAHSVECWLNGALAGGLYGLSFGKVFFGESMFSASKDASKVALVALARQCQRWDYRLIDCQVASEHLFSLGAQTITRADFIRQLQDTCEAPGQPAPWQFDSDVLAL